MGKAIQNIFPQRIAEALCHMLVSSLWEGMFLAFLTGLIILLTRNTKASLRYGLLVSALLLYGIVIVLTFWRALNTATDVFIPLGATASHEQLHFIISLKTILNDLLKRANENSGMVSGLWLLLISFQNLRLFFGLYTLNRLKRVRVQKAARRWQEKMNLLSHNLGITEVVVLLESAIVKIPMAVGYLKPVVLVPIGLINSLEPALVETILLHELAHIRRKDYLVNILQTMLETLFFFNPAVIWLSWLIRGERENCCDDIVIARTTNRMEYAEALVNFEEYRQSSTYKTVALIGPSGSMLGRLERIVTGKNRSLRRLELIVLIISLLLSIVLIAAGPRSAVSSVSKFPASPPTQSNNTEVQAKRKAEAVDRLRHQQSP